MRKSTLRSFAHTLISMHTKRYWSTLALRVIRICCVLCVPIRLMMMPFNVLHVCLMYTYNASISTQNPKCEIGSAIVARQSSRYSQVPNRRPPPYKIFCLFFLLFQSESRLIIIYLIPHLFIIIRYCIIRYFQLFNILNTTCFIWDPLLFIRHLRVSIVSNLFWI